MKKNSNRSIADFNIFAENTAAAGENSVQAGNDYKEFHKEDIEQSIVERFEEQVREYGDKCAVKAGENKLNYTSLNSYANRVARVILREYDDRTRLNKAERTRYTRQLMLNKWGIEAQEKLKGATVFAAGAGGSGSPLIMQLALAGIGTIIVCDFDEVELSNLNRQALHDESRIGMNKAISAKMTIERMNPHVKVVVRTGKITKENVHEMVGDSDIIFDNIDDMEAKFYLSECAVVKGIPHIISSMIELSSYAAIFHSPHTPCFHCLYDRNFLEEVEKIKSHVDNYKKNPNPVASPSLFLSTGFAVNEAIKILIGFENPAYNKYFFFNQEATGDIVNSNGYRLITYPFNDHFRELCRAQGFDWDEGWSGKFVEELAISKDPSCPLCGKDSKVPIAIDVKTVGEEHSDVESESAAGHNIQTVALLFGQNINTIIGIVGALKAGKVYVPLDAGYPFERLEYMLEDAECRAIITDSENIELAQTLRDRVNRRIPVIDIENIDEDVPDENLNIFNNPADLAYILYTSGSTGKPKGVMQSHRNVLHHARVYTNALHIHDNDKLTLFSSYSFDAAKMDIYSSLLNGATLYPFDIKQEGSLGRLPHWLKEEKITVFHSIPTVYRYFIDMVDGTGTFPDLRFIVLGGEAVFRQDFEKYKEYFSGECIFINGLGPTESTLTLQYFMNKETDVDREAIPVGYPVADTEIFLLTEDGREARVMEAGEIVYKSDYLALGYWNNHEKTEEVFGKDPLTGEGRVYRSGDLGRRLPAGYIEYVGRKDFQVKVRGYRIELGEIEGRLDKVSGIKKSVVVCSQDRGGENYLMAYCLTENGELNEQYLVQELKAALPDYMVPNIFLKVEEFPLTATGKIDRKSLTGPEDFEFVPEVEFVAPRSANERKLAAVWQQVLKVEQVGIDDNFFVLGGNSIRAIMLTSSIHKVFDVKIPLPEVFKTPTVRGLSTYIKVADEDKYTSIPTAMEKQYYSLSSAQKRLYILQKMDEKSTGYNMTAVMELTGDLDNEKIEQLFEKLIERHESLRTSFEMVNDEPVQEIHNPENVEFNIEYYPNPDVVARRAVSPGEGIPHIIRDFIRPFDLSCAPLLRVGMLKAGDKKNIMIVDMHHIVCDGISHAILGQDFMMLAAGEELPPLAIQYQDFSEWQNSEAEVEKTKKQEEYWLQTFAGDIPILNLPTDFSRPKVQSFLGDRFIFQIEKEETVGLTSLIVDEEVTMFMLLLAIFNVLLSKLSSQEDIIIGSPISGRKHSEVERVVGMFVNTLTLRNFPSADRSFRDFLRDVRTRTLESFENQDYQFEDLVEQLDVRRDVSRNPLFDVMFRLQNFEVQQQGELPENGINKGGLQLKPFRYEKKTSQFDLNLAGIERNDNVYFSLEYCTKLFKAETIKRFVAYFRKIVSAVVADPNVRISEIEIITEAEKKRILDKFNDTQVDYPKEKTVHQLFEEQVNRIPDHIAIFARSEGLKLSHSQQQDWTAMTYGDLNKKANRLARTLRDFGVQPDSIVGLMTGRSLEMIIGLMAILKAGGAYLPIGPEYPAQRVEYMLQHSGTAIVLTGSGEKASQRNIRLIDLNDPVNYRGEDTNLLPTSTPGNLAYVIYTSGTTGTPKGVMVENRPLVNFTAGITGIIPFKENDTILSLTTISFDIFGLETILALMKGSKIVIGSAEEQFNAAAAAYVIEREKVTIFQVTPSRLQLFISEPTAANCLKLLNYLLVGGEALPEPLLKTVRPLMAGSIFNMYGPTETTIWSTVKDVSGEKSLNVGTPIANTQIYIMDKGGLLLPVGVTGELCISGDGVARGYYKDESLTREKFIENPFIPDQRIYRTGDLARWLPDGNIDCLGRIDHQVKIRGFRIELGEIESQLQRHEDIKEAVVIVREDKKSEKYLCAYIVGVHDSAPPVGELREFLSHALPDYMIPSYFIELDKIPLSPNGKVDRKKLPEPEGSRPDLGSTYVAPASGNEKNVADIWMEVLNLDKVGIDDNFFDLGGNSLKIIRMNNRLKEVLKIEIPIVSMFRYPTIKSLLNFLSKEDSSGTLSDEEIDESLEVIEETMEIFLGEEND